MRRTIAVVGFAASLAFGAGALVVLPNGASGAAETESAFIIPASDAYGVADCLANGTSECGKVVANAWCEAQGFVRADSFGRTSAEDVTGSVETASAVAEDQRPISITCTN